MMMLNTWSTIFMTIVMIVIMRVVIALISTLIMIVMIMVTTIVMILPATWYIQRPSSAMEGLNISLILIIGDDHHWVMM